MADALSQPPTRHLFCIGIADSPAVGGAQDDSATNGDKIDAITIDM